MIDMDGAINLLAAVVRQWARDAQRNQHELEQLAGWLGMDSGQLAQHLSPPTRSANYAAK